MNNLEILDVLIQKFKLFTELRNKYHHEFLITIHNVINIFKSSIIMLPMKNNHYTDCVWSNDISCTPIDFCSCFYAEKFIKNLCFEIIELIGMEYMINF